jgi:hypothetical protein
MASSANPSGSTNKVFSCPDAANETVKVNSIGKKRLQLLVINLKNSMNGKYRKAN